jgi:hypothetical protein
MSSKFELKARAVSSMPAKNHEKKEKKEELIEAQSQHKRIVRVLKGKGSKSKSIPKMISLSSSSESGGFPPELLDNNQIYRFKLAYRQIYGSSVGGTLSGYLSIDPTVISYSEFSTLSALFNEVRTVRAQVQYSNCNPHYDAFAAGDTKNSVAFCWDDPLSSTTPTSYNQVIDNAAVWIINLGSPKVQKMDALITNRSWASTLTPSPGPYAGCGGQFSYYSTGLTASANYFEAYVFVEMEFRNRT